MTEVMNFFQSMFMFKSSAPVRLKAAEVKLAVALKSEAQQLATVADQEMHNGRTTRALSFEITDKEKKRVFAEISVWHHNRAAEKYSKAAERFEEAGRVHTKKIQAFNKLAGEMKRSASEAAEIANSLSDLLKQN